MLKIRIVKTSSDSRAVQIVYYINRKAKIFKHIGSGKSDEQAKELRLIAADLINKGEPLLPLADEPKSAIYFLLRKISLSVFITPFYEMI